MLCFGNATQSVVTLMPKPLRTAHIYGSTVIPSAYCPDCDQHSFLLAKEHRGPRCFSCCGKVAPTDFETRITVEVDGSVKKRQEPSRAEQRRILDKQRNRCLYCDAAFGAWRQIYGKPRRVLVAWDHVVPFSYDGNNDEFAAACSECNGAKHNLHFPTLDDARIHLQMKLHEKTKTTSR